MLLPSNRYFWTSRDVLSPVCESSRMAECERRRTKIFLTKSRWHGTELQSLAHGDLDRHSAGLAAHTAAPLELAVTLYSPHFKASGVALVTAKLFATIRPAGCAVAGSTGCTRSLPHRSRTEIRRLLQIHEVLREDGLAVTEIDLRPQLAIVVENFLGVVEPIPENDSNFAEDRQCPPAGL